MVRGVSLALPACGSTNGGARGADRPRDHPALGRQIQSPARSGVSPAHAPGVGELADGRDVSAQSTLVGIALMHMLRNQQLEDGIEQGLTVAEPFSSLAASSLPLTGATAPSPPLEHNMRHNRTVCWWRRCSRG